MKTMTRIACLVWTFSGDSGGFGEGYILGFSGSDAPMGNYRSWSSGKYDSSSFSLNLMNCCEHSSRYKLNIRK